MSTIVVLYGLLLGAPRHHVIIKLTPLKTERDRQDGGEGVVKGEMRRRRGEKEEDKEKREREAREGDGRKPEDT